MADDLGSLGVASVGIRIDTGSLDKQLQSIAQNGVKDLGASFDKAGAQGSSAFKQTASEGVAAASTLGSAWGTVTGTLRSLGIVVSGMQAMRIFTGMISEATSFQAAMSDVATLLIGTQQNAAAMGDKLLAMGGQFGSATERAQTLYEALSAGVEPGKAIEFVGTATKLAKAELFSAKDAAVLLATAMNAYGRETTDVTHVSDVFVETINAGVVHGDQLARALGNVLSTAALAKVPIEDVAAAVAVMTRAGIDADTATTSLNRAILTFINPSKESKELARALGIELSATALASKGLKGELDDVSRATGGNITLMAELFGDVRAGRAIMALTGAQAADFGTILDGMKNKVGQTDEAFRIQQDNLKSQWATAWNNATTAVTQFVSENSGPLLSVLKDVNAGFQQGNGVMRDTKDILALVADAARTAGDMYRYLKEGMDGARPNNEINLGGGLIAKAPTNPAGLMADIFLAIPRGIAAMKDLSASSADAARNQAEFERATLKLSDTLTAQGIVIPRGAQSLEAWNGQLRNAAIAAVAAGKATAALSAATKTNTGLTAEQQKAQQAAIEAKIETGKRIDDLLKKGLKEIQQQSDLATAIGIYEKQGKSAAQITAAFGSELDASAKYAIQSGIALTPLLQKYADLAKVHAFVTKTTDDFKKKLTETSVPLEGMVPKLALLIGEFGRTEVIQAYADEIVKLGNTELAAQGQLGSFTQGVYDQARIITDAKERIKDLVKDSNERLKEQPLGGAVAMPVGQELGPIGTGTSPNETLQATIAGADASIKAIEEHKRAIESAIAGMETMRNSMASTVDIVQRLRDAGYNNKEIMAQMAPEIVKAGDAARELGEKLSPAEQALLRQARAAESSKQAAADWRKAWQTALGNIASDFATSAVNWIFQDGKAGDSVKTKREQLQKQITTLQNEQERDRLQAAIDGAKQGTAAYTKAQADMAAFNKRMKADEATDRKKQLTDLQQQLDDTGSKMKAFTSKVESIFKSLGESLLKILVTGVFTKIGQGLTGILDQMSGKQGIVGGLGSLLGGNAGSAGNNSGGGIGAWLGSLIHGRSNSSPSGSIGNDLPSQGGFTGDMSDYTWSGDFGAPRIQELSQNAGLASQAMSGLSGKTSSVSSGFGGMSGKMGSFSSALGVAGMAIGAAKGAFDLALGIAGQVGKGRKTADDIVPAQNALTDNGLSILKGLGEKQAAGTLSAADIATAKARIKELKDNYYAREADLSKNTAGADKTSQKALSQSLKTVADVTTHWDDVLLGFTPQVGGPAASTTSAGKTVKGTVDFTPFKTAVTAFAAAVASFGKPATLPAATTTAVPSLAFGGFLSGTGLVFGHAGEVVMPLEDLKKKLEERAASGGFFAKSAISSLANLNAMLALNPTDLAGVQMQGFTSKLFHTMSGTSSKPPNATQPLTIHLNEGPVTIHGNANAQTIQMVLGALKTNRDGFLEQLVDAIQKARPGVLTAPRSATL